MSIDVGALTGRWRRAWPRCPPVGHLFKVHMPDRWVRFHSLPEGRRYPTGEAEYEVVLHRHNTILRALGASDIYVMTPEYEAGDAATRTEPIHVGLHPGAVRWLRAGDLAELTVDLHVGRRRFEPGDLDGLLRHVADDQARYVVVSDAELRWLYHPYDGGADVILPSAAERDRLRTRFADWLSPRDDGL